MTTSLGESVDAIAACAPGHEFLVLSPKGQNRFDVSTWSRDLKKQFGKIWRQLGQIH
jgi:hypothetical protein